MRVPQDSAPLSPSLARTDPGCASADPGCASADPGCASADPGCASASAAPGSASTGPGSVPTGIDPGFDAGAFADVARCAECHPGAAATHAESAHAHSSFDNPWYRAVVDRVRSEVGFRASRHCAGCHDPLLLQTGAMDAPIAPGDPLARAGVTCMVCHSIRAATTDGNASYVLDTSPVPIPDPNDEAEVATHRARMALPPLRTPLLCASCHRGFLGPETGNATFFPGIDEAGPWRASVHADQHAQRVDAPVASRDCRSCHGERIRAPADLASDALGTIASHRFAGGHTALASAAHAPAWSEAIERRTRDVASIDVAAWTGEDGVVALPAETADVRPGERAVLDVVVRNLGVGHRFPGGIRDVRDHFVTLLVRDARGRVVAEAGRAHERGAADDTTFALRTAVVDATGAIERSHFVPTFRALAWDHTLAPRDALLVRYALRVPDDVALPLSIEARLVARRHDAAFATTVCTESSSARARAFAAAQRAAGETVLDACAAEPVLEMASARLVTGEVSDTRALVERLYDHALALSHERVERRDEARRSIARALDEVGDEDAAMRGRLLALLADVAGAQGRVDEALALADEAEGAIGPSVALDRIRGHALMTVWDWQNALPWISRVASGARTDVESWRDLARVDGIVVPSAQAAAASAGLALLPRDEALLRSQALGLETLRHPLAARAREAFLRYRRPDDEMQLRERCDAVESHCARDRQPVVTIDLDRGDPS